MKKIIIFLILALSFAQPLTLYAGPLWGLVEIQQVNAFDNGGLVVLTKNTTNPCIAYIVDQKIVGFDSFRAILLSSLHANS
ncbi:MAG: hypothetical protein ACC656_02025, partial [Candidatus Heimdallarchaeota archaeon]